MSQKLLRVAVNAPLREALTYLIPENFEGLEKLTRGVSISVPLGKRKASGVVIGAAESTDIPIEKLRAIAELEGTRPALSEPMLKWLEWVSQYYVYPIGQVVDLAFPPLKKEGRKKNTNIFPEATPTTPPKLTAEQTQVVDAILGRPGFHTHLVFGVTGSGKTEIYLRLLEDTLKRGQRGLVLVPEISLTPQLISRFGARFGNRIAVLHSHLTERDRTNQWWDIVDGRKDILIGARSALFCPIENLGMIVVDEEHEPSFKQDEKLRYHARDSAVMLGRFCDCPVVLGSATPSMETYQNAVSGKYALHTLTRRASDVEMPAVEVIDLRLKKSEKKDEENEEGRPFWATPELLAAIELRLSKREQSALFLNRRGLAQAVICPGCGARKECPNCCISLTLHARTQLVCHYCDYQETLGEICDVCHDSELKSIGLGTELLEKDLERLFPSARLLRADRDEIQNRAELEEFIRKVEAREADILIGTQMIAKGLDFPHLTLVGVVLADIALNLPDFRASERGFQLLTQVSGRAGRQQERGEVFIQTFNPDHPSVRFSQQHDFKGFAEQELAARQELAYPPFGRMMLVRIQSLNSKQAEQAAEVLANKLNQYASRSKSGDSIEVMGPVEAPLFKIRNNYRFQILVKAPKTINLSQLGWAVVEQEEHLPSGVRVSVDIDPLNML